MGGEDLTDAFVEPLLSAALQATHTLADARGTLRTCIADSTPKRAAWLVIASNLRGAGATLVNSAIAVVIDAIPALLCRHITARAACVDHSLIDQAIAIVVDAITHLIDRVAAMSGAAIIGDAVAIVIDTVTADLGDR